MKIMHVNSALPDDDVTKLMNKTGESSIKDAISKAVYYYLNAKTN
ncbi:MAG: DUF5371 domain-containing protein [Methanosarcinales archaeon]|nr:DUF5371 domain-containing protein [Methanosarcinales archaeon]